MKTEIYNVEGIEIEVERTSKDDTEAERRNHQIHSSSSVKRGHIQIKEKGTEETDGFL